jgi:hypothetical protein
MNFLSFSHILEFLLNTNSKKIQFTPRHSLHTDTDSGPLGQLAVQLSSTLAPTGLAGAPLPVSFSGDLRRAGLRDLHQTNEQSTLSRTVPAPPLVGHRNYVDGELPRRLSGGATRTLGYRARGRRREGAFDADAHHEHEGTDGGARQGP